MQKLSQKNAVIVKDVYTTYEHLWQCVRGFANYLQIVHDISKDDKVVVKATQTLSYCICYFATHLCGGVFVPLEKSIADEKAVEIIDETDAKVYVASKEISGCTVAHILSKNVEALADEYFDESKIFEMPHLEESADIMYTTGTTGKAKGVEVTHSVLLATADNYITGFEIKQDNVIAVPGPLNHVNPLRKLYMSIKKMVED